MKNLLIIAFAALVAGCCPCHNAAKATKPLVGTTWKLIQVEGRTFAAGDGYYVVLWDNLKMTGKTAHSDLVGQYATTDAGRLQFSAVACRDTDCDYNEQEQKFIDILLSVDHYQMDGELMLTFRNGEMIAAFEAQK